jgi:HK97 family phage prohead protease
METRTIRGKIKSTNAFIDAVKGEEGGERRFEGFASTPNMDRFNEVVESKAFEGTINIFKQNPIMLFMHNTREPIGHFDSFELRDDGLRVSGVIGEGFHPADRVWKMITQGHLKAMSIGFREIDGEVKDIKDAKGNKHEIYHITKLELLEISVVAVPANREALFTYEDGKLVDIKVLDEDGNVEGSENAEETVVTTDADSQGEASTEGGKIEIEADTVSDVQAAIKEIEDVLKGAQEPSKELLQNHPVISGEGTLIGYVSTNQDGSFGDASRVKFFFSPPCNDNGYEVQKGLEDKITALEARCASLEKRGKDVEIALVGALRVIVEEVRQREQRKSNGKAHPDGVLETV